MDLNTPPNPLSQIPSNAPLTKKNLHLEYLFLAIAVVVIAAGVIWWQIGKLDNESSYNEAVVSQTPTSDQQEVSNIYQEEQSINIGDLDKEFEQIDKNLNSL